jgi:hypothetical protein
MAKKPLKKSKKLSSTKTLSAGSGAGSGKITFNPF